jgi:hypothetical protein
MRSIPSRSAGLVASCCEFFALPLPGRRQQRQTTLFSSRRAHGAREGAPHSGKPTCCVEHADRGIRSVLIRPGAVPGAGPRECLERFEKSVDKGQHRQHVGIPGADQPHVHPWSGRARTGSCGCSACRSSIARTARMPHRRDVAARPASRFCHTLCAHRSGSNPVPGSECRIRRRRSSASSPSMAR